MSTMKTRLHNARAKFLRRSSGTSTATRSIASSGSEKPAHKASSTLRKSISLHNLPEAPSHIDGSIPSLNCEHGHEHGRAGTLGESEVLMPPKADRAHTGGSSSCNDQSNDNSITSTANSSTAVSTAAPPPALTLEAPTPIQPPVAAPPAPDVTVLAAPPTRQMLHRKVWVKRLNASATLVQIREDDLVDDVRDMILKKYANSLGRSFDAPDVTLRIVPRDAGRVHERTLGPEEDMCRTIDHYFPGGQTVNEALIIDVPQRRTPKPSPRVPLYHDHHDDNRYAQTEYFPPMPVVNPSPSATSASQHDRIPLPHAPHSIAVINTGQLPALPSPGGTRRLHQPHRPKYARHNTASPTILGGGIPSTAPARPNRPRHDSSASEAKNSATSNNPIPTPPASTDPNTQTTSTPPTPRVASPPPTKDKKRRKKPQMEASNLPAGLLDGSVPPINVLIVEDNIINLRLLGAFMQRLKVRWQRAMNGKEAVTKWKAGGFHLVLMDIQLPVMSGLEATKEIRRLERVNSIGVFSSGSKEAPNNRLGEQNGNSKCKGILDDDDRLDVDKGLFKSPVIIVALTASSLQSDRHEALAAGCNDFLTKPVSFVWLERKVREWGCMQALIDFDGWRKWKDFADKSEPMDSKNKMSASFISVAPKKKDTSLSPTLAANMPEAGGSGANGVAPAKEEENKDNKEKKNKRKSLGVVHPPVLTEENENENENGVTDGASGS